MLEIGVLGPLEVRRGGTVIRVPGQHLPGLLAILALAAGAPVPFDTLAERLWSDRLPQHPRRALHTYISRLRALLGAELIDRTGDSYLVRLAAGQVDALRMTELIRRSATANAAEPDLLAAATGLWRGEPFVQSVSPWLAGVVAPRLTEQYLSAVERRTDLDLAAGRRAGMTTRLAELAELTEHHPLREPLWAKRIQVLARLGRPAEALACHGVVRATIRRELGVEPGEELRRVHGELLAAGAPRREPRAESVPRQLPLDLCRFTGRRSVLAELDAVLAGRAVGAGAIAVVHGTGGVGKSSAVVHWAHRVRDRFPDGQLFVDLCGHGPDRSVEPAAALDGMLRALGVAGDRIPDEVGARGALLRSVAADRRLLIVLDNALDSAQVRPLLPGPGPLVIVTSRSRLRGLVARHAAHPVAVERLSPAESVDLLRAALPHRTVDPAVLVELARLCDNLPLALAVVAEQAARRRGSAAALADELRDRQARLDLLDSGDDPLAGVRAALSASYDVLDPSAARLFRLLGLHPGTDLDPAAAAALLGTDRAAALLALSRLDDAHLVEQHRPGRYRTHDLVALFTTELAARSTERAAALTRLLKWYQHSAFAAAGALGHFPPTADPGEPAEGTTPLTFADSGAALAWFRTELVNLTAMVRNSAECGHHRAAYEIAHALAGYLSNEHLVDLTSDLHQIAVRAAEAAGDEAAVAISLGHLADSDNRSGRHAAAIRGLNRAGRHWAGAGHDRGMAWQLGSLGFAYLATHRYREAGAALRSGIEHARAAGALDHEVRMLNNLAMSEIGLGRFDRAVDTIHQAFALLPDWAADRLAPYLWSSLGEARLRQGANDDAVVAYRTAVELARQVGDRFAEVPALHLLGLAERARGAIDAARSAWRSALGIIDDNNPADDKTTLGVRLIDLIADLDAAADRADS